MKLFTILAYLFGLVSSQTSTGSNWRCPTDDSLFIARLKKNEQQRECCNFEPKNKRTGLTTLESHKLTEHVKQQFIDKFNEQFGTIKDERYVKDLLNVRYEVSNVTNLVYPIIGLDQNKFHNTRLLRSLELNDKKPHIGNYKIKHVTVPGVKAIRAIFHNITITPYETNNVEDFLKHDSEQFTVADKEITTVERDILTDGTEISGIFKLNESDSGTPYTILRDFSNDTGVASELEEWFGAVRAIFENIAYDIKQLSKDDITKLVHK